MKTKPKHKPGSAADIADWAVETGRILPSQWHEVAGVAPEPTVADGEAQAAAEWQEWNTRCTAQEKE